MPGSGKRLEGKVALVTGGGSGFGRAISKTFVAEGAKVYIGDINLDGAKETAKQIGNDDSTLVGTMDATKQEDWKSAADEAVKKFGKLDIVINNAGWSYKNKPTADVTEEEFDRVFKLNVKSVFFSVNATIPHLKKNGGGAMINIASIGAHRPRPGLVWYNSTKAAVANASRALAAEYGPDQIRVNALCPLLSGTGLFEQFVGVPYNEENVKQFVGAVPLGRLTDPQDVANAAVYLASDEGKFVTGVELDLDGGKGI